MNDDNASNLAAARARRLQAVFSGDQSIREILQRICRTISPIPDQLEALFKRWVASPDFLLDLAGPEDEIPEVFQILTAIMKYEGMLAMLESRTTRTERDAGPLEYIPSREGDAMAASLTHNYGLLTRLQGGMNALEEEVTYLHDALGGPDEELPQLHAIVGLIRQDLDLLTDRNRAAEVPLRRLATPTLFDSDDDDDAPLQHPPSSESSGRLTHSEAEEYLEDIMATMDRDIARIDLLLPR